jgi:hypothetical protein
VAMETPASRATSLSVAARGLAAPFSTRAIATPFV